VTDDQLLRYSRHILLDDIGIEGQERILQSHALIIGAGGLGSPVALYLAAAGVGQMTLVDQDTVDLTNLQRQIAHTTARTGAPKVESAKAAMQAINPTIRIQTIKDPADAGLLNRLMTDAYSPVDIVLDCTDNFKTRHAINAACVKHAKPLVSGSAIRLDGQLSVYHPSKYHNTPCYACVFPADQAFEETACATLGVLGPLVGIIGSMQAAEALKILSGMGSQMMGRLLMMDGKRMAFDEIKITRNPGCLVCANH